MFRSAHRSEDEEGFVLVFLAIMLVLLLSLAGFIVDFSNWELQGAKIQRAADASALAGAVFLPDDVATAQAKALEIAGSNGFTTSNSTIVVNVVANHPDQLNVTITQSIKNYFGQVIGMTSKSITKSAVGEYAKPVAMGSPSNQYGNDPESSASPGATKYPNFWGNVAGPRSDKISGDAYTADVCSAGSTDHCAGNSNSDYDPNGYYYTIHVGATGAGALMVQAFDPEFAHVGDHCPATDQGSNLSGAAALPPSTPGYPTSSVPPSQRYAPVANINDPADAAHPGTRYCTGDQIFNNGADGAPNTTYKVIGPATLPGDPSSAPQTPICTWNFTGVKGDLTQALTSSQNYVGGFKFIQVFRQWFTLCTINNPTQGDYFVQVTTSSGAGHNRFALRAGLGCGTSFNCADTSDVSVFGNAKMAMYANVGVSTTRFYLARVTPSAPGRTLTLSLYDIGDAQSGVSGSLQIMSSDASGNDSILSGCQYTPPGSTTYQLASSCTISGVNGTFNGRWINVQIPVPDTSSSSPPRCDASKPTDCWFTIHYTFNGGLQDTTSWTARLDGDPVRIVK